MDSIDFGLFSAIVASAAGIALAAVGALSWLEARRARPRAALFGMRPDAVIFLFDGEVLADATPAARQLLSFTQRDGTAWSRLVQVLLPRFPGLVERMERLSDDGSVRFVSADERGELRAEFHDGMVRVTLIDLARDSNAVAVDRHSLAAMEGELATLRTIADRVPYLTWKETREGAIVWANAAYLDAAEGGAASLAWPPRPVFPAVGPRPAESQRIEVALPGQERSRWFEVMTVPLEDGHLRHALPVDAIVAAEVSRAEFVQTLTKTFANLTVGLAIFDRSRRLGLFNPALTDLTGLPVEFLALRPSLHSFVDRLREARVLPEPKSFLTWRQRLSDLERAAEDGRFEETWTLADGRVFRASGRPHPDGAIAFLIEDVTAEMSLTRSFRSELKLNQAVLDTLDEAVVVFSGDGSLALANAAYCRMWGLDPRKAADSPSLSVALRNWRESAPGAKDWSGLADSLSDKGLRKPLGFTVDREAGRRMDCRFVPLPGGALMAGFTDASSLPVPEFRRAQRDAARSA